MNCLDGIIAGDHAQVCRVEVDGNAGGIQAVKKIAENIRGLRAGFDGKTDAVAVGKIGKCAAGLLHDLVAVVVLIFRNNADMRGNDRGIKVNGKLNDTLGFFDKLRV